MSAITRRRLLTAAAGTGAVVVAGGAGLAAGILHPRGHRPPPTIPSVLRDGLVRESALIAGIDAVTDVQLKALLAPIRADHVEHRQTISAMIAQAAGTQGPAATPTATPSSKPELLAAERAAQTAWATASAAATGEQAALFASISACEATHAALLT